MAGVTVAKGGNAKGQTLVVAHFKKKKICQDCNGKGGYDALTNVLCGHCAGTGRDTHSKLWAEPCRFCNGRGKEVKIIKQTCRSCGGSGTSE
jgi:DnaJ-class molecular chaperone